MSFLKSKWDDVVCILIGYWSVVDRMILICWLLYFLESEWDGWQFNGAVFIFGQILDRNLIEVWLDFWAGFGSEILGWHLVRLEFDGGWYRMNRILDIL